MPNLLGTAPNQVPTNADLGKLAFMDVVDTVTNNPYIDTAISDTKPSLLLDFANSKTLDPRITYTRASTAMYYDGKTTAVAEQNLLTYSQDFDNAIWNKSGGALVTANTATAPDGTTTADKLIEDVGTNSHTAYQSFISTSGTVFTFSFYAKAAERSWVRTRGELGVNYFDLTNGVSGTLASGVTATINSAGSGWYRISVTKAASANGTSNVQVAITTGNNIDSYIGDGTSGIYIWGAQLEQRSSVSAYTPTTSSLITNYIPALQTADAGVPRFDHDPVTGESKGFLIEEQRTNLLTYSNVIGYASFGGLSYIDNAVIAPNAEFARKFIADTSSTYKRLVSQPITVTTATVYTQSVYLKKAELTTAAIRLNSGGSWIGSVYVDLSTGTITSTTDSAIASGIVNIGNGWYRVFVSGTTTSTSLYTYIYLTSNTSQWAGDGYSGIYIWGAQVEAGSFATSYIPTTSAQVTRSADAASMTGANFSGWYNVAEGTLYAETSFLSSTAAASVSSSSRLISITNGTTNEIGLYRRTASNDIRAVVLDSNVAQVDYAIYLPTVVSNTQYKVVFGYKTNDFSGVANGASTVLDSSGSVANSVNKMSIGYLENSTGYLNGTIKKLAYYPKRLSNDELMEMTQ